MYSEPAAILGEESSMGRRKFISFLANIVPRSGRVVQVRVLDIIIIIGLLDRAKHRVCRVCGGGETIMV